MRLTRGGNTIMSNMPSEIRDLVEFRLRATGDVLINGLGLGIAAQIALANADVSTVTVIAISGDVIGLVAPHIADHRLRVIQADAHNWRAPEGMRWDVVWHDIWDDICADNLSEMAKPHRRYGRRCDWQGSWCRAECERAGRLWRQSIQRLASGDSRRHSTTP